MLKLLKWYMTWRQRHVLRYIGKVPIKITLAKEDGGKTITVFVLFSMSPSNKRKIEWPSIKGYQSVAGWATTKDFGQACYAWEKGGDLPEEFIPTVDDGFKQLLRAIVDQEMGLKEE